MEVMKESLDCVDKYEKASLSLTLYHSSSLGYALIMGSESVH